MIEILNWVAAHFLGTLVFMVVAAWCLAFVISAIRGAEVSL